MAEIEIDTKKELVKRRGIRAIAFADHDKEIHLIPSDPHQPTERFGEWTAMRVRREVGRCG